MPPRRHPIWDMCFLLGHKLPGKSYYPVRCLFCQTEWKHGKLDDALKHIAQICKVAPEDCRQFAEQEIQGKIKKTHLVGKRHYQIPIDDDEIFPEDSVSQVSSTDRRRRNRKAARARQISQKSSDSNKRLNQIPEQQENPLHANNYVCDDVAMQPPQQIQQPPDQTEFIHLPDELKLALEEVESERLPMLEASADALYMLNSPLHTQQSSQTGSPFSAPPVFRFQSHQQITPNTTEIHPPQPQSEQFSHGDLLLVKFLRDRNLPLSLVWDATFEEFVKTISHASYKLPTVAKMEEISRNFV